MLNYVMFLSKCVYNYESCGDEKYVIGVKFDQMWDISHESKWNKIAIVVDLINLR